MRKVGGWHARAILLRLRANFFKAVMNNVLVCCTTLCVKADVCSSAFIIIMQKKFNLNTRQFFFHFLIFFFKSLFLKLSKTQPKSRSPSRSETAWAKFKGRGLASLPARPQTAPSRGPRHATPKDPREGTFRPAVVLRQELSLPALS